MKNMKTKIFVNKNLLLFHYIIYIFLFNIIYSFNIPLLKANYFNYEQITNLYYVNALNNNLGILYFEYWGEANNIRHLIGINTTTGDDIYFGNTKIKSFETSLSSYHTSIIINNNNEDNIFSINVNNNNLEFININSGTYSYKSTENEAIFDIDILNDPSLKNGLAKLNNNNYILSVILYVDPSFGLDHYNFYTAIFNFNSNSMNGYNQIQMKNPTSDFIKSTNCFQTESNYIECFYNELIASDDYFSIIIYDTNLNKKGSPYISTINPDTFTKMFHIKKEIGAYIYFEEENNYPKIKIKKLNENHDLDDVFTTISLNVKNQYNVNQNIFLADGIKINDNRFVIILTSQNLLNLLIYLFDLYNEDKSLKVRLFNIGLQNTNIRISNLIQAFTIDNFLGITFYNSNLQYSGYTIFNYPNFIDEENSYINNTLMKINLFIDSPLSQFSFSENIELANNIFGDKITKIKIIDFKDKTSSGITIKSLLLNSEISKNNELDYNDHLIFESCETGAIPGNYILNISLVIQESNNDEDNSYLIETKYYGDTDYSYTPKLYNSNQLRLEYIVQCYEKCKTCRQIGTENNNYCVICKDDFPYNINNGEKCENQCHNYIFINGNIKYCIENCNDGQFIYDKNENEKYCLDNCNEGQFKYIINQNEKYCLDICNEGKFIYAINVNEKYCLNNCDENQFNYIINENEKYCLDNCYNNQYIYIDNDNKKACWDNCDNSQDYLYIKNENEKYCLENCFNELFIFIDNENKKFCEDLCDTERFIYITDENKKTCINECDNTEYFIYIKDENEQYCLKNCGNELFFFIDNDNYKFCKEHCDIDQYIYIKNENEKFCKNECDNNQYYIYIKETDEKFCLSSCVLNNEKLFFDKELKICYNKCSEGNNSKIYSYKNECISKCPKNHKANSDYICILESDEIIIEREKKIIAENYNENLEIEQFNNETKIICYSTSSNLDELIDLYPDLIYIDLKECEDLLIKEYNLDPNSDLLIVEVQTSNEIKNYSVKNFNYEIYTREGKKLNNLSFCENTNIEISTSIKKSDLLNYKEAIQLSKQGYDIYNLSSDFYTDICLSASINDSDLTLSLRQQVIYPGNNSLCMEGCEYNGIDLETNRVNCTCNPTLETNSENKESDENIYEEVEQNFFIYIIDMINYQIFPCYKLIVDKNSYINNFGFYIGAFLLFLIIINMLIYIIIGGKIIRHKFYSKRPKINKIKEEIQKPKKNNVNINDEMINHYSTKSLNIKFSKRKQKKPKKVSPRSINDLPIPEISTKNSNPNKKVKRKKVSKKNILKKNLSNMQLSSLFKKSNNIEVSSGKMKLAISDIPNNNKYNNNNKIQSTIDKNSEGINNKKSEEKDTNCDYNELSYFEALEKDKRNYLDIFFYAFKLKLKTIQIFCFRDEFSHLSLSLSFYVFELLLDITINSLLFSDDVISQKYFNNGDLLFITTNILSISSNIISYFILWMTEKLINQNLVLDNITKEIKDPNEYIIIYEILIKCFKLKLSIFYFCLLFIGFLCTYYLFLFCAIFKKIQINLFENYIIGSLWSLAFTVAICLIVTITRKIALKCKIKKIFIWSKFFDDKF